MSKKNSSQTWDIFEFLSKGLFRDISVENKRETLAKLFVTESGAESLVEAISKISDKVVSVGFFAGAGERWVKSLAEAGSDFNPKLPRVLFKPEGLDNCVGYYNYRAFCDFGKNIIIYRDAENLGVKSLLEEKIVSRCNSKSSPTFFEQQLLPGKTKVSGHGDAMRQISGLLREMNSVEYVVTYFGNDASSKITAQLSVLALDWYRNMCHDDSVKLVLPTAYVGNPDYLVELNERNIPTSTRHAKLSGNDKNVAFGDTNLGIRVYSKKDLIEIVEGIYARHTLVGKTDYSPMNTNHNDEFGLDHIDQKLMSYKFARVFRIGRAEDAVKAKEATKIGEFCAAINSNIDEEVKYLPDMD